MFYKLEDEELQEANSVIGEYFLFSEEKDSYEYPDNGWYWFDTIEDAKLFFGIA
jgi:hypothetical protein